MFRMLPLPVPVLTHELTALRSRRRVRTPMFVAIVELHVVADMLSGTSKLASET
jgi:hypothetical protein